MEGYHKAPKTGEGSLKVPFFKVIGYIADRPGVRFKLSLLIKVKIHKRSVSISSMIVSLIW